MNLPKEKPALLWESALRDIAAAGVTLAPDDLVWLHTLARKVYRPDGVRLAFARAPIHVGTVWLYPLALCWLQWLEEVVRWWGPQDMLPTAFACAMSDGETMPTSPSDPVATRAELLQWGNGLSVSAADLEAAVMWVLGDPGETVDVSTGATPTERESAEWGEILCLLSGAYHLAPWELVLRPVDEVLQMIDTMPSPAGIYSAPTRDQRRKTALAEFQAAVRHLKRKGTPTP